MHTARAVSPPGQTSRISGSVQVLSPSRRNSRSASRGCPFRPVQTAMLLRAARRKRLRITDVLAAGDASPSELAAMLAMPSNLLAHHVHVLEEAGIIIRRRSEGTGAAPICSSSRARSMAWPGRLDRRPSGCCSSVRPIPPARTWPLRCGGGPAQFRRYQRAPIRLMPLPPGRSLRPGGISCPCPGCAPVISARSAKTAT